MFETSMSWSNLGIIYLYELEIRLMVQNSGHAVEVGGLSHHSQGFYTSQWLLGISSISDVSQIQPSQQSTGTNASKPKWSSWLLSLGSPKVSNSEIVKGLSLVESPHQAATVSLQPFSLVIMEVKALPLKWSPKQISMIWAFHHPTSSTLQNNVSKNLPHRIHYMKLLGVVFQSNMDV